MRTSTRRSSNDRGRGVLVALLAVATAVLVVVLSLAQSTEEAPARRTLARAIGILSEIDAFLDDQLESLRREAEASDDGSVDVTGFPVRVSLTSEELLEQDLAAIRSLILERAADQVYEEGSSSFREDGASGASVASKEGLLEEGMDAVRSDTHGVMRVFVYGAGAAVVLLATLLLLSSPLDKGLVRTGAGIALGALAVLLVAGALRLAFSLASAGSDDYLTREFFSLAKDLTWAPLRNGVAFGLSAAFIVVLGVVLSRTGIAERSNEVAVT